MISGGKFVGGALISGASVPAGADSLWAAGVGAVAAALEEVLTGLRFCRDDVAEPMGAWVPAPGPGCDGLFFCQKKNRIRARLTRMQNVAAPMSFFIK